MKKFLALMRVSFRGMIFSANPSSKAKKKSASSIGFLALMSLLMLYIGGVYSFSFAQIFSMFGRTDLILTLLGLISVAMCFLFGVISASGFVFGGKDNDILLAMPVGTFPILLSKVLSLYLENIVFTLFILLPAGGVYLYFTGFSALFIPIFLLCVLFLPLLPSALSLLLGFLFTYIQSKVRHKALVNNLLYLVFFGLVFGLSFGLSGSMAAGGDPSIIGVFEHATGWALPLVWMTQALTAHSLVSLVLFLLSCAAPFFLIVWVFSLFYKKILTRLVSVQVRHDYKLQQMRGGKPFAALYKKELRRLFGTPIYLMNSGLGALMLLGGGIYAFVAKGKIASALASLPGAASGMLVAGAAVVAFCILISSTTCASISLEGNRLWILREAPVPIETIFAAKILTNCTLMVPAVLIGVPFGAAGLGLGITDTLLLLVLGLSCAMLTSFGGLFLNLLWPKLDAVNDTVVVKRSMSVMIMTFGGIGLIAAGAGLFYLLVGPLGLQGALWAPTLLYAVLAIIFFFLVRGPGKRMFRSLIS